MQCVSRYYCHEAQADSRAECRQLSRCIKLLKSEHAVAYGERFHYVASIIF
jgi:hypothetical protein